MKDQNMKICSLLPSTTEIVCALGLRENLVGITHECDFPEDIASIPVVTESLIDHSGSDSWEIDKHINEAVHSGSGIYKIKELVMSEIKPDLILTQELCEVCAVSYEMVESSVKKLSGEQAILSFEPSNLQDIFDSISKIATYTGVEKKAATLLESFNARVCKVKTKAEKATRRPKVLGIEWLDPPFIGGHWVPEIIEMSGGTNLLGSSNTPSRQIKWDEASKSEAEIAILMVCGFDLDKTVQQFNKTKSIEFWDKFNGSIYAVNGSAYFSRPGPRIIDGLEILAEIIQPDLFPRTYTEKDWVQIH